jgi:hypothetical protein
MAMEDGEIVSGLNELTLFGNESDFQILAEVVLLDVFAHRSGTDSTEHD